MNVRTSAWMWKQDTEEGKTATWVRARQTVELPTRKKWNVIKIQKANKTHLETD